MNSFGGSEDVVNVIIKDLIGNSNKIITTEGISISKHSLFCGMLAIKEQASSSLIAAALLHDIGHAIYFDGDDLGEDLVDIEHAEIGAAWLSRWFPKAVTEPIKLHVIAKRYYYTKIDSYKYMLSEGSRQSLQFQGGRLSEHDLSTFETSQYKNEAMRLRNWDDTPYDATMKLPSYDDFSDILLELISEKVA